MIIMFKHTNRNMGGWEFVKVDTESETFVSGSSGSTSVDMNYDISAFVSRKGELEDIVQRLTKVSKYEDLGRK